MLKLTKRGGSGGRVEEVKITAKPRRWGTNKRKPDVAQQGNTEHRDEDLKKTGG